MLEHYQARDWEQQFLVRAAITVPWDRNRRSENETKSLYAEQFCSSGLSKEESTAMTAENKWNVGRFIYMAAVY